MRHGYFSISGCGFITPFDFEATVVFSSPINSDWVVVLKDGDEG